MASQDVVVVGGGLSGLMAAALLAKDGTRVRLVESSASLGGMARTRREHGYAFNLGAHAMFSGGHVGRVLKRLGIQLRAGVVAPATGRVVHDDRIFPLPTGPLALLASDLFDRRGKRELLAFLARPPKASDATLVGRTLEDFLDQRFSSERAKAFLKMFARLTTLAHGPSTTSAAVAIEQMVMVTRAKTLYLHGGWQSLVDDLRQAASRHGVVLETSERAAALRNRDGCVSGVELEAGRTLAADAVILAVPPRSALQIAPDVPELRAAADASLPVRMACLDVGLSDLPRPDLTYALGLGEPLYYSVHSRYAELAPRGSALVHVMRYLAPGEAPDDASRAMEQFLDFLQPGWPQRVEARQDLPEITVSSWWPRPDVSRPSSLVESVSGLYLAGEWVGPDGLLAHASAASATAAAGLAASHANGHPRRYGRVTT
ncbi:MAG TPA: FAD-dependent oxidoreductase [Candidatus Thermoplasmatota archaeon]|nr:FAD-dependent oxidoreductase [Candidatus Thermoplasmatota archaeon]